MDQLNKQNQQKDNKNEQQPIKKDEKDQIVLTQPQPYPKIKEMMIMRMQTGKDGMDFEGIAEESQLKENFSKVLKDVLLSQ